MTREAWWMLQTGSNPFVPIMHNRPPVNETPCPSKRLVTHSGQSADLKAYRFEEVDEAMGQRDPGSGLGECEYSSLINYPINRSRSKL